MRAVDPEPVVEQIPIIESCLQRFDLKFSITDLPVETCEEVEWGQFESFIRAPVVNPHDRF